MSVTATLIVGNILEKIADKVMERFTGEPVSEFLADRLTKNRRERLQTERHFMNHDIVRALCRSYYKALIQITVELKSSITSYRSDYHNSYLPDMLEEQLVRLRRYYKNVEDDPNPIFPIHSLDGIGALIKPDGDPLESISVERVLTDLPAHLTLDSMEYKNAVRAKCFDYTSRFFAGEIKDNQAVANKLHAEYIVDQRVTLQRFVDYCGTAFESLMQELEGIREIAADIQVTVKDGFAQLSGQITDLTDAVLADRPRVEDWLPITDELLEEPSPDLIQAYYEGRPVEWSLVQHGYTAERQLTREIVEHLKPRYFQAALIHGPGGEGKTTVMYQVALALRNQGYSVYEFNKDSMKDNEVNLRFDPRGPSVFVVDDVSEISNLGVMFSYFRNCRVPVKLLMTVRKNEWLSSSKSSSIKLSNEHIRFLKEFPMKKLARDEANGIAELLVRNGAVAGEAGIQEVSEGLYRESKGFLLAGMLQTTQGQDLETIIRTIIQKIKQFENGDNLVNALAIISLIEAIGVRKKEPYACTTALLAKILEVEEKDIKKYWKPFSGEVIFETLKNTISTRHGRISTIMYQILLESSDEFEMDPAYIYKKLLYAAGDFSRVRLHSFESKILNLLPEYIYETHGYEEAIGYYEVALRQNPLWLKSWTDYIKVQEQERLLGNVDTPGSAVQLCYEACNQYFEHTESLWRRWAEIEQSRGNLGDRDTPYTAVWIAREGAQRNPDVGLLWKLWAEYEKMADNEGTIDTPNSARWILHTYWSRGNHDQNVYALWLRMERKSENYGAIDQPYSALWLANQMTIRFSSNPEGWITWSQMETILDNVGSSEVPNSARWIAKQGAQQNPSSGELWFLWAEYEWRNGNEGTIDQPDSARWILKTYCDAGYRDQKVYGYWLRMELQCGNIGTVEEPYTARWIANQFTLHCPKVAEGWSQWSEIEREQNNIGSIDQPYSAIWLLKEGIDLNRKSGELWKEWGALAWASGDIGDIDTPYTARWVFSQGTAEARRYATLWEEWAKRELEETQDPGDVNVRYTPRWIAKQATVYVPDSDAGWLLRAQIEIDQRNYGTIHEPNTARGILHTATSNGKSGHAYGLWAHMEAQLEGCGSVDQPYTARWLFLQSAKKYGYSTIASPWAKMEYENGNIGDLHTLYTSRWILWTGIQEDYRNNNNWLRFLSLEYDGGNMGSIDEPSSALWVFDQWYKKFPPMANISFDYVEGFGVVKQLYSRLTGLLQ